MSRARKFRGATAQIKRPELRHNSRFGRNDRGSSARAASSEQVLAEAGTYKTELCNKFMESGRCPYGLRCQFAHGEADLRRSKRSMDRRFKTQKCRNFHNQGFCRYGSRCQFIHDETNSELRALRGGTTRSPNRSPNQSPEISSQQSPNISPGCKSSEASPVSGSMPDILLDLKLLKELPRLVRHDSFRKLLLDVVTEPDVKNVPSGAASVETASESSLGRTHNALASEQETAAPAEVADKIEVARPKRLSIFRRMCSDSITDPLGEIQNSQFAEPLSPHQLRVGRSMSFADDHQRSISPQIVSRA